jgi:3-oxoacyl-(acyl-carrier-protein) synthase
MKQRIAITGIGVVAPNGIGVKAFEEALRHQVSGIKFIQNLADASFACQVGGIPEVPEELLAQRFDPLTRRVLTSSGIKFGILAAWEAWEMAGLPLDKEETFWDIGTCFGTGLAGVEPLRDAIYQVDQGQVRRLGSRVVEQTMPSGISAYLTGIFGLGGPVMTNSSACATGTESVILAAEAIRAGKAKVMMAGSCDSFGPHIWGGFDSMRVLARHANDQPTLASAPLSDHAAGFVPAAGAGALILEDWDHALARGVPILAEYLDGATLAGGQRNGGTMTAPNPEGVRRCLTTAMQRAEVLPQDIDLISGHLTSTMGDRAEVAHWAAVLNGHFPFLQAPKTYVGHCLAAAGAIEAVSCVLQLQKHFIFGNANSRPLHPDIAAIWPEDKIPTHTLSQQTTKVVAKSSFGFGDVNACFFLKRCE